MRSSSWTRRSITLALGMTVASTSAVAAAEQFVVIDETWTHSPDLADSHKRFDPSVSTPGNWVSPIDYSQGTAYVYLEVHTKPTAQETKFQEDSPDKRPFSRDREVVRTSFSTRSWRWGGCR
ncbi:MAG: hypothetical protein KC731_40185 [Myxococcales bacterium]|nr:hypothetical protein [Myxococcales bacterium]